MSIGFPVEIIERILYYCDGATLNVARLVHPVWSDVVDFLEQKTPIWRWCCNEEIPRNELVNYIEKYDGHDNDDNKWFHIYHTWYAWKNLDVNIQFDTTLCPVEVPRITYVAVSGPYIAVGSEDGRIKIFEESWGLLHTARYQAVRITEITFMSDEEKGDAELNRIYLLVAYKTGTLVLTEFDGKLNELVMIQDVKLHSVYKKYLCYEKRGGRITISKLCRDSTGEHIFCEITFLRIYSPNEVSCLHMWGGVATFLINNQVKVLKYDQNIPPVSRIEDKVTIGFCMTDQPPLERSCHIYRDDIILCTSISEQWQNHFLELFILGEKDQYSKKSFDSWEVLQANITCMFLYGNTFVLGVDIGNIYFYHVPSWKSFDIRNYQKKIIIGRHPIIGMDVKETERERKFFVTSSFNIHQVVGFRI